MVKVIKNTNFSSVLIVSNGCEMAAPSVLEQYLKDFDRKRIKTLTIQEVKDKFEVSMNIIEEIMVELKKPCALRLILAVLILL